MIYFVRSDWGAQAGRGSRQSDPVSMVVLHHALRPHVEPGASLERERSAVRGIERYHVESNGWLGIGYNFLVSLNGHVYEGRGWGRVGAHAAGVNSTSVGVCLLMDGDEHEATPAAIEAVRLLIERGRDLGHLTQTPEMTGHRDHLAPGYKSCPGELVYPRLAEFLPEGP